MASLPNVSSSSKSRMQGRTTQRAIRRGDGQRARRNRPGHTDPPPSRAEACRNPAPAPKNPGKNRGSLEETPHHKKHRGPVVPRENRGSVHPTRPRRRRRRGDHMGSRQHATTPEQCWGACVLSTERRAEIDGLLSPLLHTALMQGWGDPEVLVYSIRVLRGELRQWRKPVQSLHNVATEDRGNSAQLSAPIATEPPNMQAPSKEQPAVDGSPKICNLGCNIDKVCGHPKPGEGNSGSTTQAGNTW
ncbi:putative phloem RNA movement protein [Opium poppy mosaic virus]|uniref:Phloem RNA movement protein n=1 Tax=Opium poppy mosaic virus TaxID=473784 RepID=G0KUS6_9TOMB|nr:putative phloem RNA movement protein [Opium poppy mosaic virus]AEJ80234.2 putative phloem RNA movement protein [Opium poppy mosaic virus]